MIKIGQTKQNIDFTLPYQLNNDGDTEISLNDLYGNTTQSGTPTPTSPQEVKVVKGKNIYYTTQNTYTFQQSNASWRFLDGTGGASGTGLSNTLLKAMVYNGKKYTFTASISAGSSIVSQLVYEDETLIKRIDGATASFSETFTASKTGYVVLRLYVGANISVSVSNIQLEENSSATSYLPYNTIQAKVVGKNLFINNFQNQTINGVTLTKNADGSIKLNGTSTSSGNFDFYSIGGASDYAYFPLNAGTYTLSGNNNSNCSLMAVVRNTSNSNTIIESTTGANTRSVQQIVGARLFIRIKPNASFNNYTIYPQLEKSSTATTYEPYKSNNYPITLGDIELCKIGTYQDRIYKQGDKWYLEKQTGKLTLSSSQPWTRYTDTSKPVFYFVTDSVISYKQESSLVCYCDYFQGKGQVSTFDNVYNLGDNVIAFRQAYTRLVVRDDTINNTPDFKTWLDNNKPTLYYVLATPTTTEITNDTLLEQLEAIAELYRGTNNIMITDTIAPVENIIIEKSNAEFDLVPYIKREPKIDYIDRKGDTGYTADGHYFENIIARKRAVEFELIPMSQEDYADVISRFMNITSIPVFISDTYTNQNLKLNMFKKAIISNTQLTEYGRIRGTKISLEEI